MSKITCHKEKVRSYAAGNPILPVTLELDLTSQCTRDCPECPSTTALHRYSLDPAFLDKLLDRLGGGTTGLLLTGGEPTMSPLFPAALRMARERGFREIAVVTNGSLLDQASVADALLAHASTIRLSLYDWDGEACEGIEKPLRRIERLRKRIESEASALRIGISALTSASRAPMLGKLVDSVRSAGAHWLYFHPLCTNWGQGGPVPTAQDGVPRVIRAIQAGTDGGFEVFTFAERYRSGALEFDGYHAAHFLLVIGADGKNYLGPEVKYQPKYVIADPASDWSDEFLWRETRLNRCRAVSSRTYVALQSRHRGVLYNHVLERLRRGDRSTWAELEKTSEAMFRFPHIL